MIINDTHRFTFVHIPKCAGTTVRASLQRFDESGSMFSQGVDNHFALGTINYFHIPLFVLREHFSEAYEKIVEYQSFAVVRDPYSRFASSLAQRLKQYGTVPLHELSIREVQREVERSIKFLSAHADAKTYLPHDYNHFQRQVDFIIDQGDRIVEQVYTTADIPLLLQDVGTYIGLEHPDVTKANSENVSTTYRSRTAQQFVSAVRSLGYLRVRPLVPEWLRASIRKRTYVANKDRYAKVFRSKTVTDFISWYYAEDIDFVQSVQAKIEVEQ